MRAKLHRDERPAVNFFMMQRTKLRTQTILMITWIINGLFITWNQPRWSIFSCRFWSIFLNFFRFFLLSKNEKCAKEKIFLLLLTLPQNTQSFGVCSRYLDTDRKFIDLQIDLIPEITCLFSFPWREKPFFWAEKKKQKSFLNFLFLCTASCVRQQKTKTEEQNLPVKVCSWLFKPKTRKLFKLSLMFFAWIFRCFLRVSSFDPKFDTI